MVSKMRAILAVLGLLVLVVATPAQAGPLFPLQLGGYYTYDGSDLSGHTWQASTWVVAQNINLNSQSYFHIRNGNWQPYGWPPRFGSEDRLIRSDEVAAYISMGGPEWLQFQTSGDPQNWTYYDPPDQTVTYDQAQVNGTGSVTVPYGGPYQAYENQVIHHEVNPPSQSPPWYPYLVPNLGLIKTVQNDVPAGGTPMTQVLKSIGTKPVSLFPMKTGMFLIYNASDSLGNTWKMTRQVLEQVIIQGQAFFRVKTTNFDPIGGESGGIEYLRSTAQQVFRSWDGVSIHIEYQANSPGTFWSYPAEGGWGTCENTITGVTPVEVLGGSYLAYVHRVVGVTPEGYPGLPWFNYAVPGLGLAKEENWRLSDPTTRLYYTLASITQVGPGAAVSLLLD